MNTNASDSCSFLIGVERHVISCCRSPSTLSHAFWHASLLNMVEVSLAILLRQQSVVSQFCLAPATYATVRP